MLRRTNHVKFLLHTQECDACPGHASTVTRLAYCTSKIDTGPDRAHTVPAWRT